MAFACMFTSVKYCDGYTIVSFSGVIPLSALGLSILILGECVHLHAFIVAAILVINRRPAASALTDGVHPRPSGLGRFTRARFPAFIKKGLHPGSQWEDERPDFFFCKFEIFWLFLLLSDKSLVYITEKPTKKLHAPR